LIQNYIQETVQSYDSRQLWKSSRQSLTNRNDWHRYDKNI